MELAHDLACRFNTRYGHTFTAPQAVNPPVAARIRDLTAPGEKMSKSTSSTTGALRLLDGPDALRRKVMRAVTDSGSEVVYDPDRKPGTSNLLAILASCTADDPERLAPLFDRYSELKQAVADTVVTTLAPVRERYVELAADPEYVRAVLRAGAKRAREQANEKVRQAKAAIGLLPA